VDSYLLEKIDMLIKTGKYDTERLKTMRKYVENDRELYQTDKKYLEKILMFNDYGVQNQTRENPIQNNTELKSDMQSHNEEGKPPQKTSEYSELRNEVDELKEKIDKIENHLVAQTKQKMNTWRAVGGVILLAIGLLMVVGGGASAIASMCVGQPLYGSCRSDTFTWTFGVVIFWIGMIPSVYGIKYVASA